MGFLEIIISVAAVLVILTVGYKLIPCRDLPETRPGFTLFPKYRTAIDWSSANPSVPELEEMLAGYGFKLVSQDSDEVVFHRGKLLGDFSVKLLKLKCTISVPKNGSSSLAMEAGWMIAFDTGDLWTFTSELKQKLQSGLTE